MESAVHNVPYYYYHSNQFCSKRSHFMVIYRKCWECNIVLGNIDLTHFRMQWHKIELACLETFAYFHWVCQPLQRCIYKCKYTYRHMKMPRHRQHCLSQVFLISIPRPQRAAVTLLLSGLSSALLCGFGRGYIELHAYLWQTSPSETVCFLLLIHSLTVCLTPSASLSLFLPVMVI